MRIFGFWLVLLAVITGDCFSQCHDQFQVVIPREGCGNVFRRLNNGQPVTIVYLGGSVTESEGWRVQVSNWFRNRWPGQIVDFNAGWSGTGSAIGATRFAGDVLAHDPDLVFIEFAVNDETGDTADFIMSNCEGMVRQAWKNNPVTDLIFVETIAWYSQPLYTSGQLPHTVAAHYEVADDYGIASVNVGWALYRKVLCEGQRWEDYAPDRVHPNAAGHLLYSAAVVELLQSEMSATGLVMPHAMPAPVTAWPIENVEITDLAKLSLPTGWHSSNCCGVSFAESSIPGNEIDLAFSGPLGVLKFVKGPGNGVVSVRIDGLSMWEEDMSFGWDWVWAYPPGKNLSLLEHTVRLHHVSGGPVRLVSFASSLCPQSEETPTTPTGTPTHQASASATFCFGDADGDDFVSGRDFRSVRDSYGSAGTRTGDANGDGFVNVDDFRMVRDHYGRNCS